MLIQNSWEKKLKSNRMKLKFKSYYFIAFILLFIIEALIAKYLKDGFIRHTFGDFLVVILLYCFLKSFLNYKSYQVALVVFIISFLIEFLQLTNFLELLHLEQNKLAKIVLGSTFSISDLVAYTLGIISILIFEHKRPHGNT